MEQKDNSGAIFKNDYKKTEQQPDYKGKAMVNGQMKDMAMWLNESKSGVKYFSVKFSEPYEAEAQAEAPKQNLQDLPASDLPF